MSYVSESLRSLSKNERCEQSAQVPHQKWAMWAKCSGPSPKMSDHAWFAQVAHQKWANHLFFWAIRSFAHYLLIFFAKNPRFTQKTDERITNPEHSVREGRFENSVRGGSSEYLVRGCKLSIRSEETIFSIRSEEAILSMRSEEAVLSIRLRTLLESVSQYKS